MQERFVMNPNEMFALAPSTELDRLVSDISIAQLVGQVYESAPPDERGRLLDHLLRPLGVLSLVSVANGIFARIGFRNGWPDVQVKPEDAQNVQVSDVITLVNHVQQINAQAVYGLTHMLASSPMMTRSAAAAPLMTVLLQRGQNRRAEDYTSDDLVETAATSEA
jgi:hypothetical protein